MLCAQPELPASHLGEIALLALIERRDEIGPHNLSLQVRATAFWPCCTYERIWERDVCGAHPLAKQVSLKRSTQMHALSYRVAQK
jgi:hypothetical protein